MAGSLSEALAGRFAGTPSLVAAFGHVEAGGPHKFWLDAVDSGSDGAGVAVPPPYVVCSVLGSGGDRDLTFDRGYGEDVAVLLKTFATDPAEAARLGGLVNDALLSPSKARPPLAWDGGREVGTRRGDDRTQAIPGRGVAGSQLYGRYTRWTVSVAGRYA